MTWEKYYEKYAPKIQTDLIARNNLPHVKALLNAIISETYSEIQRRGAVGIHEINDIIEEQNTKLNEFSKKFSEETPFKSPFKQDGLRSLLLRKIFGKD